MATSGPSVAPLRGSVSPLQATPCARSVRQVSPRQSICSPVGSRTSIHVASPSTAQPPRSPRLVSDGRPTTPVCFRYTRNVPPADKNKCDCHYLTDNVKSQFEHRLSSLEVLVRSKLSDLDNIQSKIDDLQLSVNVQANIQGFDNHHDRSFDLDAHLQSKLQSVDNLNSRVSDLEANQQFTARTLQNISSLTCNSKSNDDTVTHVVAVINSHIKVLSSELRQNSKMINVNHDRFSRIESEFRNNELTVRWMECQILDLSRRLHKMGSVIEETIEKQHGMQLGMTKLANDFVGDKGDDVPSSGSTQQRHDIPQRMRSLPSISEGSQHSFSHGDGIKDPNKEVHMDKAVTAKLPAVF